jgi:single-strand DNA-binding protein
MSYSRNRIEIIGNLGADPELKYTPTNRPVANISVATNERWKDAKGEKQERTEWHRVVCWGELAENVSKYLRKGSSVFISGPLQSREYTSDKDGISRRFWEIKALEVGFLDGRAQAAGAPATASQTSPPPSDADIPF